MNSSKDRFSRWPAASTNGLGEMEFMQPPGTFALTPASGICLRTIWDHQALLHGRGLDWGSGVGCLAIAAARIPRVEEVLGLEISESNVRIALENARRNGVSAKTGFVHADSYEPKSAEGAKRLASFIGKTQFVLANPPSSEGDDGFEFRRVVLRGARAYLVDRGVVLMNVSSQYGLRRIERLDADVSGYRHGGVLSSSDWVPFDLGRPDLLSCLETYAAEEARGGDRYAFVDPDHVTGGPTMDARAALARFRKTQVSPLTQWQTHLFRRGSADGD